MYLPTFMRRDAISPASTKPYDHSCSGSLSWFRLCPVDFILWALLLLVVCFACWKVYTAHFRVNPIASKANHKRYKRLMLLYPSGSYNATFTCRDRVDYEGKHGLDSPPSSIDPYHVVKNIDDSLISKDARFNGASVPQPVLDQRKSGRLSGNLGLGLGLNITERYPPVPEHNYQEISEKKQSRLLTPPPPPAYVHNARWDHV